MALCLKDRVVFVHTDRRPDPDFVSDSATFLVYVCASRFCASPTPGLRPDAEMPPALAHPSRLPAMFVFAHRPAARATHSRPGVAVVEFAVVLPLIFLL